MVPITLDKIAGITGSEIREKIKLWDLVNSKTVCVVITMDNKK
jgi:hypothetical protein